MESHTHTRSGSWTDSTFIKAIITGALMLLMMIPMGFISNLVKEREQRQKEVVQDANSKWADAQTFTSPYLVIPYTVIEAEQEKTKNLIIIPQDLKANSTLATEERTRSIFKIILYRSQIQLAGKFVPQLPANIPVNSLLLNRARLCVGLSDYKGIEERLSITANNNTYNFQPGLPVRTIDSTGLSAPFPLTPEDFGKEVPFAMTAKIKGSSQLHFVPLSANSVFTLESSWPSPSFDGHTLPSGRKVSNGGFSARWNFNQANLPFPAVITNEEINKKEIAFGVSVIEPADQYVQTMRSVKYSILVIGLTFALFFIVELMQKQPVHPVQYILVGLALTIFYTLLLSISEFIAFDTAYLIAALATLSLITLYAKGHFRNWKSAGIFAGTLSILYGFIFVIIRLEDAALLTGSAGLFVILAVIMYASRKINWYRLDNRQRPEPVPVSIEE